MLVTLPAQLRGGQRPAPCSSPRVRAPARRLASSTRAEAAKEEKVGFGYTRLDAILLSVGLPLLGWASDAALEAGGMAPQTAGNVVLLTLVGGVTLVWTATYVARLFVALSRCRPHKVVSKDMTYVKQLDAYEAAVMAKRLEELPEGELEQMLAEVEREKQRRDEKEAR